MKETNVDLSYIYYSSWFTRRFFMRTKLKELGVGTKIVVYGQYIRVGGNDTVLVTDVYNKENREYLCDHLWLKKYDIPWNKEHNDFVVVQGTIYEYQKYYNLTDYNIMPIKCVLIKPFVFNNTLVYMLSTNKYQSQCWFYSNIRGFNSATEFIDFRTDEILYLFEGNDVQKGYTIIEDNEEYYDLYYKNKNSNLRVYKTFNTALSHIDDIA